MRQLKILGLTLMTVLALGLVAVETASAALPWMTLPEFLTKTNFKGTSGTGELATARHSIKCTSDKDTGEAESKKLGQYNLEIKGCAAKEIITVKCNTRGDATEVILTPGTWHLVLTTISGVDVHLILFLTQEVALECSELTKIVVKAGTVLGEITPANQLTKNYTINFTAPNSRQQYTTYENDSGDRVSTSLLSNFNGGAFEPAVEITKGTLKTELDTLIIN